MERPWKLFWSNAKRCWIGKWKDAESGAWKNKVVPCEHTHEQDALDWFAQWWAGQRMDRTAARPVVRSTVLQLMQWWAGYLRTRPGADPSLAESADRVRRLYVEPFAFARVETDGMEIHHCVDWIEDVQRMGKADFTVRNVVQMVRTMFSDARGKGRYRGENFFNDAYVKQRLRNPQPKKGKDVVVHLSPGDAFKVASYDGDLVPLKRHARNVLAMLSGLRSGELHALRWCDLDLDVKVPHVRVNRQLVRNQSTMVEPTFKPPKCGSKRNVPLHPLAVAALRRWREAWSSYAGVERSEESPVFAGPGGVYLNDYATRELSLDLVAYGASPLFDGAHRITPHAMRRTCLTLLTNAGANDGDVKEVAGHAKAGVTRKHYVGEDLARLQRAILSIRLVPPTLEGEAAE